MARFREAEQKLYKMNLCADCVSFHKQEKKPFFACSNKKSKFYGISSPRFLTWRICYLYEEIFQGPEGIKFIEEFRRKEFKDSVFWIISTDPNLDFYPNGFFKDKFSIAVNLAWRAFPESTFFAAADENALDGLRKDRPDYLKKCITIWKSQRLLPLSMTLFSMWRGWRLDLIHVARLGIRIPEGCVSDFEPTVKQILNGGPCRIPPVWSTSHLALYSAAILGAKKIVMVANSHKIPILQFHSHRPGLEAYIKADNEYQDHWRQSLAVMEKELVQLTKVFGRHGVEIVRHRFDEEKEEFVFEKIVEESIQKGLQ